jgi:hypothetical protein
LPLLTFSFSPGTMHRCLPADQYTAIAFLATSLARNKLSEPLRNPPDLASMQAQKFSYLGLVAAFRQEIQHALLIVREALVL